MKKTLAALATAALAASSLLALAPAASAAGCVTTGLTTGYKGIGGVAHKAASGCSDLNLTHAHDTSGAHTESYAAFYKNSANNWIQGSRGYVQVSDGSYSPDQIVLVSDLTPGRAFSIASYWDGGDYVEITH
ncbi:hypothetical protein [Streptomyces sp. NPDC059247]|uniref:hypothetical protein n=1 Tax=Streptomyces sp. NPDC059247 TaxID=3346790 RepID=UPI0036A39DC9